MLRKLKATGSVVDVLACSELPLSGPLGSAIEAYLDYLSSLGKQCTNHRVHLVGFERFLRKQEIISWQHVTTASINEWLQMGRSTSGYQRRCKLLMLDDLFRFLINQGEIERSPVPAPGPHRRRYLPPHIFTHGEIKAILDTVRALPDQRLLPYRGETYRMVLLTLYTLGLRINEALNLRLQYLDFTQHCLTIRQSKFYKGRVLPFGPRYERTLLTYLEEHPLLRAANKQSFLFPSESHRTLHLVRDSVYRTVKRVVKQLEIKTPPETRPPNLHSFRHSFAVHRVEQWLREGADLEVKLPLLSAFLGHFDVAATQVYLTMTPDRLALLGELFEQAVGMEVRDEEIE